MKRFSQTYLDSVALPAFWSGYLFLSNYSANQENWDNRDNVLKIKWKMFIFKSFIHSEIFVWCFLCAMKCSTHLGHSGEQINRKLAHLAVIHEGRSLKVRQQAKIRVAYCKSSITKLNLLSYSLNYSWNKILNQPVRTLLTSIS